MSAQNPRSNTKPIFLQRTSFPVVWILITVIGMCFVDARPYPWLQKVDQRILRLRQRMLHTQWNSNKSYLLVLPLQMTTVNLSKEIQRVCDKSTSAVAIMTLPSSPSFSRQNIQALAKLCHIPLVFSYFFVDPSKERSEPKGDTENLDDQHRGQRRGVTPGLMEALGPNSRITTGFIASGSTMHSELLHQFISLYDGQLATSFPWEVVRAAHGYGPLQVSIPDLMSGRPLQAWTTAQAGRWLLPITERGQLILHEAAGAQENLEVFSPTSLTSSRFPTEGAERHPASSQEPKHDNIVVFIPQWVAPEEQSWVSNNLRAIEQLANQNVLSPLPEGRFVGLLLLAVLCFVLLYLTDPFLQGTAALALHWGAALGFVALDLSLYQHFQCASPLWWAALVVALKGGLTYAQWGKSFLTRSTKLRTAWA